jgi:hypothetical protein
MLIKALLKIQEVRQFRHHSNVVMDVLLMVLKMEVQHEDIGQCVSVLRHYQRGLHGSEFTFFAYVLKEIYLTECLERLCKHAVQVVGYFEESHIGRLCISV